MSDAGMSKPKKEPFFRRHRWLVWLGAAVVVVLIAASVVLAIVAKRFEPYLRARVVNGLAARFHTHVELDGFHVTVNNIRKGELGIWATGSGLRIWPPQPVNGVQALDTANGAPLISLDEFEFHMPLRWEQTKMVHIGEVQLKGLHVVVPPRVHKPDAGQVPGEQPVVTAASAQPRPGTEKLPPLMVDRVVCEDADLLLETNKPGKLPMHFPIPHITLTQVTLDGVMNYVADVVNPKPQGLVHAEGSFGPWITQDPGSSAINGTYHMDKADMGVFKGIAGLITSDGKFSGTLRALAVTGTADVPDFRLTHFGAAMPLETRFVARVDGTDGDTWLDKVNATLGRAQFETAGQIVRVRIDTNGNLVPAKATQAGLQQPGIDGHLIDLNVNVAHAPVEEFLKLTSKNGNTILSGIVVTKAHLLIPPGHDQVEQRLKLDGTFDLAGVRFKSDKVQGEIQQLSLRGEGKPGDIKGSDPTLVRSEMRGTFHMEQAAINLPDLEYNVPGADVQLKGTYTLQGDLNFTGTARMDATISQMLGGWKGVLAKPADKFFEKDGAGTLVPITITGTREAPKFSVDFSRMGFKGTRAESPADKKQ